MELDDLKQSWHQAESKTVKNTDIMELIQHKSYGPIAALKRAFLRQIRAMIILPFVLLLTNVNSWQTTLSSVLYWSYVVFCVAFIVYAWYNYRIVGRMEVMDGRVKANLQQQIHVLETRLRRNIIGLRIVVLYFIVMLEVLPYIQHFRMLEKWHAVSPWIRFGAYAGFLLFQYVVGRRVYRYKFGNHLAHLKNLVKEMED